MSTCNPRSSLFLVYAAQLCIVCTLNAQPYAYVSNLGSNNIAVVNTANFSIVASIVVPFGPTGVGVTPNGSMLYVASQSANTVSIINTSNKSILSSFSVCATPTQLAANPNGQQVMVVCQGSDQVSVIDTASSAVVSNIQVGSRPSGVAFNPSGTRAYVTNLWSNNVSIIDTAGRHVTGTFGTDSGPAAVAVSRDGGSVYVANEYANTITVHDPSGLLQSTIYNVNYPNSMAMAPNGGRLYVTNGNASTASVIDTDTKSVIAVLGVGLLPTAVTVSTDGRYAFITNEFGLSVSVVDTGNNSVVNTIQGIGVYPVGVAMATLAATSPMPPAPPPPPPVPAPAPTPTPAPAGCSAQVGGDHWKGEYFTNMTLSGSPSMMRDDGTDALNFDWGNQGSPSSACGIPGTLFSARWTRLVSFAAGTYRFSTSSDDGMRLYIDGEKVQDRWYAQAANLQTVEMTLASGTHTLVVEYYQAWGNASAAVSWQQLSGTPVPPPVATGCTATVAADHWKGEYFNNVTLSGTPMMMRDDGTDLLTFNWGNQGSPSTACNVPGVFFSARWTRLVNFKAGAYRFSTSSDDGIRIYVDGQMIQNRWFYQGASIQTVDVTLAGGTHTLVAEYFQGGGQDSAAVSWQPLP